jgi:hypothetical protein
MNTQNPELLPCPFCGSDAEFQNRGVTMEGPVIDYSYCRCVESHCTGSKTYHQIKKWNTRSAGWQPIETAPKDGTFILIYESDGRVQVAAWVLDGPDMRWCVQLTQLLSPDTYPTSDVTHWMPLPSPPTGENDENPTNHLQSKQG